MKKILILAYDFPPLTTAGAARPFSWYKNAKKFGYYPIVVARKWPNSINQLTDRFIATADESGYESQVTEFGTIYTVNHLPSIKERMMLKYGSDKLTLIRKFISVIELIGRFNFSWLDDKNEMNKVFQQIASIEKPAIIIATGEPHILFTYCKKYNKRSKTPYVIDYRDGWHTNHKKEKRNLLSRIITKIELKQEVGALNNALFFTSVIPQLVDTIRNKILPKDGYVIPNSVDIDMYNELNIAIDKKKFRLVNTGTIYDFEYIDIFEAGIEKFITENNPTDFEVHFYGLDINPNNSVEKLKALAKKFPQHIFLNERKSKSEIIKIQKEATLLLNLIPGSHEKGIIAMKTYEYLAAKRPIIVIPSEPSKKTPIFPEKKYLTFALTSDEVCDVVKDFYTRYKNGDDLNLPITEEELYSISNEHAAKILFQKLDEQLNLQ